MERQIESLDPNILTMEYLKNHNLLWFYYSKSVFTKFNFQVNKELYSVCDILRPENRVDAYPLLIDLVRKKKL